MRTQSFNKIFQIGFNKCGTFSFHELFENYTDPKINSIHWDFGKLAYRMHDNLINNKSLLDGYENFVAFTDMEVNMYDPLTNEHTYYFMFKYFDILDKQYPNSKFILNTRSLDNWIRSRLNHKNEFLMVNKNISKLNELIPYHITHMNMYHLDSISRLVEIWKKEWYSHHKKVRQYFFSRQNDLLIYDIENDDFSKISDFFNKCNINFSINRLPLINKTE